jgi:hypothetical protein
MGLSRRGGLGIPHNNLMGRDALEAHPIESVTGLDTRLENIELVNSEQQTEIESLAAYSDIDGGAFGDSSEITYEGGTF